jgi:hypothetical protein
MMTRRQFALLVAAALAGGALPAAAQYTPKVTMYKNPSCGCCGDWAKHMEANGFRVETQMMADVTPIKQKFGVPESLYSCHTAVVGGYAIEGHVPAKDVWRLLREKPAVKGLSVPGMVVGSPGMETGPAQRFATIAFSGSSKRVFAQH